MEIGFLYWSVVNINSYLKNLIRTNFVSIVEVIGPQNLTCLADSLFAGEILSIEEIDRIKNDQKLATTQERCRELLCAVLRLHHPRSGIVLATALEKYHQHLSHTLGLNKVLDMQNESQIARVKLQIKGNPISSPERQASSSNLDDDILNWLRNDILSGKCIQTSATHALITNCDGRVTEVRKGCTELLVSCRRLETLTMLNDICRNGQLEKAFLSDVNKLILQGQFQFTEMNAHITLEKDSYRACYAILLGIGK